MRTRRVVAAVVVVGVALAGCTSDDGALDLTADDGSTAPVENEPPVEVTEDPDPPPPDDDEEQLYPPLPPLEPDPDSDISADQQAAFLAIHADVYAAMQTALASTDSDLTELADLLDDPVLSEFIQGVRARRDEGIISRSPDTTIEWVAVVDVRNGPFDVRECRIVGPETGLYEVETGAAVDVGTEPVAVVFQTTYELTGTGDDLAYRAVEVVSGDDERCRA